MANKKLPEEFSKLVFAHIGNIMDCYAILEQESFLNEVLYSEVVKEELGFLLADIEEFKSESEKLLKGSIHDS